MRIAILTLIAAAAFAEERTGFFLTSESKTASAAAVVDAKGGHHVAFIDYVPQAEKPKFFYFTCAADCTNGDNWNGIAGGEAVNEVQLALTPSGQPRLMVRSDTTDGGHVFAYLACDHDCDEAANWDGADIFTRWGTSIFDLHDNEHPQRSFALDPWGRPRLVYFDRNYKVEPDHYGTFYAWCDSNCTRKESWKETQISTPYEYDFEPYAYPSLTFTSDGAPRLIAGILTLSFTGQESGVYYAGCDRDCHKFESWRRVFVTERGQGDKPGWDLELDNQGRPRAAIYGGPRNDRLTYAWCDAGCFTRGNWRLREMAIDQAGGYHPDLELTAYGLPRIAYVQSRGGGIGYLACDANCESMDAVWQSSAVETARVLDAEYPVARPQGCDAGLWTMMAPVLALDGAGRARIAYDAKYDTRCLYQDPQRRDPPYYRFTELWHTARLVMLP